MKLNIKIDNILVDSINKFNKKDWDNFVKCVAFEVYKTLINRRV